MLILSDQKSLSVMILPMASQMTKRNFIFQVTPKLFTIGTITLLELGALVSYITPKIDLEELKFDFLHTSREVLIDKFLAHLKV